MLVTSDPQAARAGYLLAPPLVAVDPGCTGGVFEGTFDATFTFRLRNFTPNAEVTVVIRTGEPPQSRTVTVGPYGALDAPLTFTLSTMDSIPIEAFETANPRIVASTTIQVPCLPTIRLTPNCDAPVDPAAPRFLSVIVEGFNWGLEPIRFQLLQRVDGTEVPISGSVDDTATAEQEVLSVTLGQAYPGSDDVSGPLSALPVGDYFVRATNGRNTVDVDFAVPCAQLALAPSCGEAGAPPAIYDLAVIGSGFRPFVPAQVIFDAFGQPQVFQIDVLETGQLVLAGGEEARIQPFRRPEQLTAPYAVTVRQGTPENIVREASVGFVVPCPPQPDISIVPLCGPPQLAGDDPRTIDARLTGVNLAAGVLTVTVDPEARGGDPQVLQFGVAGTLDTQIQIARRPTGSYQIVASEEIPGAQPFVKTFTFDVPCAPTRPRLRLRCDPRETSQPELSEVVLDARGFYEDGPIELIIGGAPETVRTDASGEYNRRTPSANLPAGPLEVRATQRDAIGVVAEATATIILPCGTREPTLVISPPVGRPGLVVVVRGFNLRPNTTLSLRWSQGIGSSAPIDITVDTEGTFTQQVLLFHHDFTGERELAVEASDDPLAVGISVPFLVGLGSGIPPAFRDGTSVGQPPLILRR